MATAEATQPREAQEAPLWVSVREAAEWLRVSQQAIYQAVGRGTIPAKRIGTTIRIPRDAVMPRATVE